MFKRMKLATMLCGGFGLLIAIILGLGGVAVWTMISVQNRTEIMAEQYVPEMVLAAQTERTALNTMYNMRGYALSGAQEYLDLGRKNLADVKESLKQATELVSRAHELHLLAEALPVITASVNAYEQLVDETDRRIRGIAASQDGLDRAADQFTAACRGIVAHQRDALQEAIAAGSDRTAMKAHLDKIMLTTSILELGASFRVDAWKSQARRDVQAVGKVERDFDEILTKLTEFDSLSTDETIRKDVEAAKTAALAYQATLKDLFDNARARDKLQQERNKVAEEVLTKAEASGRRGGEMAGTIADETKDAMSTAYVSMVIGLAVAALLGVTMAVLIVRAVTRKLIAETQRLLSASSQLKAAAQQQLSGASEQSTAANQVSAAMRELAATAEQIVERTTRVNTSTDEAANRCDQGRTSVNQAQDVMKEIRQKVEKVVEHMLDLNTKSQEINMATEIITELSEQTTILSYNAAIEAAAAGDAGQSFAVVADQVGKLADRAKEAAREVRRLIEDVQKATSTTVMATEDGLRAADRGLGAQDEASQTMVAVADGIRFSLDSVREIELSSRQQSSAAEQVREAMSNVVTAARQSETSSKQTLSTADQLLATANTLKDL